MKRVLEKVVGRFLRRVRKDFAEEVLDWIMGDDEEQFGIMLEKSMKDDFNKKYIKKERTASDVARELLKKGRIEIVSK